jgi:hypothetical protein
MFTGCFFSPVAHGGAVGAIPGIVAETSVSSADDDYQLRSATLSDDGEIIQVIVAASIKGRRSEPHSLLWLTIDESGQVLSRDNLSKTLVTASKGRVDLSRPWAGSNIVAINDRIFVLLPFVSDGLRLVDLSRAKRGDVAGAPVDVLSGSPIIHRVMVNDAGRLVLHGSVRGNSLVAEIDTNGETIHAFPPLPGDGRMTVIGSLFESDGNATLIGERGNYSDPEVWVGRVSAEGEVLKSASFSGRPLDIVRGGDGTYVVLFERSGPERTEIVLKAVAASDFGARWSRVLVERQLIPHRFEVAPVSSGGFIVAGVKERGLWVSRLDSTGTEIWTYAHDPESSSELEMVDHVDLDWMKDDFVVTYGAYVVVGREQREVVRAVRFKID